MRVLWITTSDTFYNIGASQTNTYNGVGWVAAQQIEMMKHPEIQLGVMFVTSQKDAADKTIDGVKYYPIREKRNKLQKLLNYYKSPSLHLISEFLPQVKEAIDDFRPDLLHIFGIECPLSEIIEYIEIPHVVHIQGSSIAIEQSYFPPKVNLISVYRYGDFVREMIFRNGFALGYKRMKTGSLREKRIWKSVKNVTGRTSWDKSLQELYGSQARYVHVDEILRPEFYDPHSVSLSQISKIRILSTLSDNLYKGLDLVFKAAQILNEKGIDFEWNIVGISARSSYRSIVSKALDIKISQNIKFLGRKNAEDIKQIMLNSTLYVHPSYIDNSPNSLCEAQILGLPVIATNVGGVSSLVKDGYNGLLVPSNEPDMLVSKILDVTSNLDKTHLLSQNGITSSRTRHNKVEIISKILNVYAEIANR